MNYGLYKNARNAAWQCLIDFKINSLPVNVSKIAAKSGIKIIKDSKANILKEDQSGMTIVQEGKFYIVYKDSEAPERCRFTVAHELGHIFLGHLLTAVPACAYRTFTVRNDLESSANVFARDLLAPACILHELGATSPEDIAKICDISLEAAHIRATRLRLLEERNAWYLSPLERKVRKQFEKYIRDITNKDI